MLNARTHLSPKTIHLFPLPVPKSASYMLGGGQMTVWEELCLIAFASRC